MQLWPPFQNISRPGMLSFWEAGLWLWHPKRHVSTSGGESECWNVSTRAPGDGAK